MGMSNTREPRHVSVLHVRAFEGSALLPVLPRQSSLVWLSEDSPADRLLGRSVLLTPEAFPTLPWYPCAVTPLLHGGWQEGRM